MKRLSLYIQISLLSLSLLTGLSTVSCSSGGSKNESSSGSASSSVEGCKSGKVTVWGEAPVYASQSDARMKAKEDACRSAVSKCIGDEIAAQSGTMDGQSIGVEIFSKARGICKDAEIIDEKLYSLDTVQMMRVTMRYTVQPQVIQDQINVMQQLVGNPSIMVLIREELNVAGKGKKVEGFNSRNSSSASPLRDFLTVKGYKIIDGSRIVSSNSAQEEALAENLSEVPPDLIDKAVAAGADVLILGSVTANPQNISGLAGTDFKSYNATGNVVVLSLWGQSKIVGEFSNRSAGAGLEDTLAAKESVRRFTLGSSPNPANQPSGLALFVHQRLSQEWGNLTRNNALIVHVSGIERKHQGTFRDDLIERTGVKQVNEISSDENSAKWEVIYPGKSFALSDQIAFYGDDPRMFFAVRDSGKKIKITQVKRGDIYLEFR